MRNFVGVSTAALIVACLSASPVAAQGLLGGILGGDGGDGGLLDIDTDDGLEINLLDETAKVQVGGSRGLVDADVGNGLVEANVNTNDGLNVGVDALRDTVQADVNVGGSGGLADIDVNIGDDDDDDDGNPNGPGDDGNPGDNGNNGNPGNNGNNGTNGMNGSGGNRSASLGGGLSCLDASSPIFGQLSSINYSSNAVARWRDARNVQFIPISICNGLGGQLGSGLLAMVAPSVPALQMAFARTSYSARDVLGIIQTGSTLNVYVD